MWFFLYNFFSYSNRFKSLKIFNCKTNGFMLFLHVLMIVFMAIYSFVRGIHIFRIVENDNRWRRGSPFYIFERWGSWPNNQPLFGPPMPLQNARLRVLLVIEGEKDDVYPTGRNCPYAPLWFTTAWCPSFYWFTFPRARERGREWTSQRTNQINEVAT